MSDKNRRALGRGLDAILQSPETDITSKDISGDFVAGAIAEIDINLIETNPFQPRTEFDETALKELAQSIKEQGVVQPVTVRKLGYNKYQLISGERRLRASKMAGLAKIPVFIRVANDEQMLELALIENIHRENLNAIEVAISYQRLIDECNMTQEEVSDKVGKSRSAVANFLRLLKLPAEVQIAIRDGHITMGHARRDERAPNRGIGRESQESRGQGAETDQLHPRAFQEQNQDLVANPEHQSEGDAKRERPRQRGHRLQGRGRV